MLQQEEQLSTSRPYTVNFADSLAGQSIIALLNVVTPFLRDDGAKISIFFDSRSIVS